jgi:hypothetical protein
MAARPLSSLGKWLLTAEGGRPLAQAMQAHAIAACGTLGIPTGELKRHLEPHKMRQMIDCVVADVATQRASDGRSYADQFLAGPGRNEPGVSREHIAAVRDSGMGLYRIEKVHTGLGFILQDLIFRGPSIPIVAQEASRQAVAGNVLCARLLRSQGVTFAAGGHYVLPGYAGENLRRELATVFRTVRAKCPPERQPDNAEILKDFTFMFSNAWLACELPAQRGAAEAWRQSA